MKAKEIIDRLKEITIEASLYLEKPEHNDADIHDLRAAVRGIRMTNLGRQCYFEELKRKAELKNAPKELPEIPEQKIILSMTKEALVSLASGLQLTFDESMKKMDLVELIEAKRVC